MKPVSPRGVINGAALNPTSICRPSLLENPYSTRVCLGRPAAGPKSPASDAGSCSTVAASSPTT
jgi:hypothetical protein